MADPGIWSPATTSVPIGPIKVNTILIPSGKSMDVDWSYLNVNSSNYAVQNLEYKIENSIVKFRYPTTSDPNGPKTEASSIQEIADDSRYVANYGYSTNTTTAIQSSLQNQLTSKAQSIGWAPTGTQPAPQDTGDQSAGTTGDGNRSGPTEAQEQNPFANVDPSSLGKLENQLADFGDKNKFGGLKREFLKYPTTIDSGQDRLYLEQIQYIPADIAKSGTNINEITSRLGNREGGLDDALKDGKIEILGSVILPIPNELSETNTTGWGESSLSSISAAFMGPAARAAKAIGSGDPGAALAELKRLAGGVLTPQVEQRLMQYLTANAGASILKFGGINVDPEAYISRVTGTAINPNLELLFNGPKLRQFGFSFKMTPRSPEEARNIRSIVKFFKKGMAPRRTTVTEKSIYLGTPNVFRISFKSAGEIGGIGRIKTCALVSCGVNYTPDGFYAAYADGNSGGSQPIATVLSLAFTELTPIYNDDYDAESEDASSRIGPEITKNYVVEGETTETPPPSYSQGARQGPTPGGQTLDVNQAIQQTLIEAAGPLPGGG